LVRQLREESNQEVLPMMPIDMTAQLAPVFWGMVAFLALCGVEILVAALHNGRHRTESNPRPEKENPRTDRVLHEAA